MWSFVKEFVGIWNICNTKQHIFLCTHHFRIKAFTGKKNCGYVFILESGILEFIQDIITVPNWTKSCSFANSWYVCSIYIWADAYIPVNSIMIFIMHSIWGKLWKCTLIQWWITFWFKSVLSFRFLNAGLATCQESLT